MGRGLLIHAAGGDFAWLWRRLGVAQLQFDHAAVSTAAQHQIVMLPALGDATVFYNGDLIGMADGAETVGDDDARAAGHQRGE